LGIHGLPYTTTAGEHPSPPAVTPTFPPTVFHNYPNADHYLASSPPEIRQPQPRRPYTTIAPNPIGDAKRKRDEMEQQHQELASSGGGKRRKRTSSVASADLSDEDRFLVQLKEDENLPWKDIATRFHTDKGKHFQVAALQMRYKRLREKFRVWEDQDVQALKLAHEYWEKYKWEIISAKVCFLSISIPRRTFQLTLFFFVCARCSILACKNVGPHDTARGNGKTSTSRPRPRPRPRRTQ
jgi:hypothetical protein